MDTINKGFSAFSGNADKMISLLEKMVETARPENAFGQAITVGEKVVITAAEVAISMGVGFGSGSRPSTGSQIESEEKIKTGGGGGGGGACMSRPIAVVVIGPDGSTVQPVFDTSKIAIAAITAIGSIFIFMMRMLLHHKRR